MQRILLIVAILDLIVPAAARAADTGGGTINTPNNDAYTTAPNMAATTTSPPPRKHPHRKKRPKDQVTRKQQTVAPTDSGDVRRGSADSNTEAPGMSDSLGTNNPSGPNLGTSDHVPGTTGTSGQ
jgi:hypothetical protein